MGDFRCKASLTIEGNDLEADYTSIFNEAYIRVQGTDIWQVSESSDGLDLRETLRFDPAAWGTWRSLGRKNSTVRGSTI